MRSVRGGIRSWGVLAGTFCIVLVPGAEGLAQTPTPPTPAPALPAPGLPNPPVPAGPPSVEQLAGRLRDMEARNRELVERLERSERAHEQEMRRLLDRFDELSNRLTGAGAGAAGPPDAAGTPANPESRSAAAGPGDPGTLTSDETAPLAPAPPRPGSLGAALAEQDEEGGNPVPDYTEGQFAPFLPPTGYPPSSVKRTKRYPLSGSFGPGFEWRTDDDEYRLVIHYESQIEGRVWGQPRQIPANSGLFLPRQRIFFSGNISKPVEYEFAINRGSGGNLNLLNAFINLHLDDRFQLRFGRYFTPFAYEQYAVSNYWLLAPERSVFTTNLSPNRQFGVMGWGYLFDERLDYAAGFFNGSRNSFESLHNGVDFVGYLNARPFQRSESLPFLKFLNVGTSVAFGPQGQQAVPVSFRIAGGSPNSDSPGAGTTPFLILNPGTIEQGNRLLGSVHAAYYYKSLSLLGEWQYGYGGYATASRPTSERVAFSGYYVAAGYFLTGEQVQQRSRVRPLRPLIPRDRSEQRGPGAWEAVARVGELRLGQEVFTGGFADPALWSNSALTTELGLNWYWNSYIKIYTFWLHGNFGDPVLYRPGGFQKTADMFWLRFQLYF